MDNRPIGIFDSGVGGLSILLEVKKLLPDESVVYFADQANVPYGSKSESEIKAIAERAIRFLLDHKVKLIIIACNTATVYALDHIRAKFDVPIIGTVPVVKTIVDHTKTGKVAIFSTPATAKSKYLESLIRQFADGKKVLIVGNTNLEAIVEKGEVDDPKVTKVFEKHLLPLAAEGVDSLALACTHYPFLKSKMKTVLNGKIKVYDSGGAIARQAKRVLKGNHALAKNPSSEYKFFTSGDLENFRRVGEKLTKFDFEGAQRT